MPRCRYCREQFYAPAALASHGRTRRTLKRCPTTEEMKQAGWRNYQGLWFAGKAGWVHKEERVNV